MDNTAINSVYATLGGGVAYLSGSILTFTSNVLSFYNTYSSSDNGGAFYFNAHTISNTHTITFTDPSIDTSRSQKDGGFIYGTGVGNIAITITEPGSGPTIQTVSTTTGNGGLFALENTGTSAVTVSGGVF